jgi:hypothetical protein
MWLTITMPSLILKQRNTKLTNAPTVILKKPKQIDGNAKSVSIR